jgi:hypothetical protein
LLFFLRQVFLCVEESGDGGGHKSNLDFAVLNKTSQVLFRFRCCCCCCWGCSMSWRE